jgi:GT2 family glycosyltransferase
MTESIPAAGISPRVTIILLNWNGAGNTVSCLAALATTTYPNYGIVVIDNGSTDDSVARIKSSFPDTCIMETGRNLGYAGGNNLGIRYALEHSADYVWILNNDTIVDPGCLQQMVEAAESDKRIGMVGSMIFYLDTPQVIWYAGGTVDLKGGGRTRHIGKDEPDIGRHDTPGETDYITGCSMLVRRELIDAIGLMDENYFLYFEDVDWCLKARKSGWKLCFEPQAVLLHAEGAQLERLFSDRFIYYTLRNRLYFMKRFAPGNMLACHLLQLRSALYFAKSALKKGFRSSTHVLSLTVEAYIDYYLRRRMGHKEL